MAADQNLEVNNSLSPCTTEIACVRCTFRDSREVVFVDTPAFPDSCDVRSSLSTEQKVGGSISKWFKEA